MNLAKKKGFTLIEVVIVLAIAALILIIVFLAVTGAQRSRRDEQRRNDLARVISQLENWASNNNGNLPLQADSAAGWDVNNAGAAYVGPFGTQYIANQNINDPATGSTYKVVMGSGNACTAGTIEIHYQRMNNTTYNTCIGLESGVYNRNN